MSRPTTMAPAAATIAAELAAEGRAQGGEHAEVDLTGRDVATPARVDAQTRVGQHQLLQRCLSVSNIDCRNVNNPDYLPPLGSGVPPCLGQGPWS